MSNKQYLTVSALVKYIKFKLENDDHLKNVYLRGEISNLVKHSRGHLYFSVKDEESQVRAIMFAGAADKLPFVPKDGDKVLAFGSIDLYVPSGGFSINIKTLEPDGIGALYLAYEKLKNQLEEKGYFSEEHKKPIPKYPKAIGVVTSPTGAAIEDIKNTIERRYPLAKVYIYPSLVQGENAKDSIAQQIKKANKDNLVDVLIVGRGGGSIEDLWAFNEEAVIMAIYNSKIPIISAVGHETDFTISDFVSDLRAPTPTGAAELATPDVKVLYDLIKSYEVSIQKNTRNLVHSKQNTLVHLEQRLLNQKPTRRIKDIYARLEKGFYDLTRNYTLITEHKKAFLEREVKLLKRVDFKLLLKGKVEELEKVKKDLTSNYKVALSNKDQILQLLMTSLNQQNPLKLMTQGYTITTKDFKRLSSIDEVIVNDYITTTLKDGKVISLVTKKEEIK